MKALKACAYVVALAAAIGFYIKSDQLVKKMDALDQTAYASAPLVPGASQPSAPVTEPAKPASAPAPAAPAPVAAKPEPPKPAPVLLPGAGASVYLGGASSNKPLTGKVYRNADLVPGGTPPKTPADTSPPHLIISVGRNSELDLNAVLRDKRLGHLNCTEVSIGRLSCTPNGS